MEKLLEEVSFNTDKSTGETVRVDDAYVNARLSNLAADEDLSRYVL
jgi:ATP-dependent HslUV protease ATP-binding subunit HslU